MGEFNSYQPSSVVNLEGLALYLPFDDNRQYLGARVIKDYSPNSFTVGFTGTTPTYINMYTGVNTTSGTTGSSNFNRGIFLTGTTVLTAATNSAWAGDSTGKKLSVFTWVSQNHLSITPADRAIAACGYVGGGTTGWRMLTRETSHDILVVVGVTTASIAATTPQRSTAHIGFTYDGANIRVYKNGQQVGANVACTATLSTSGTNVLNIGGGAAVALYPGYMDEFCLFRRTLSAAEVAGIYSASTPLIYTTGNTFFNYDEHVNNWALSMSAAPTTYFTQQLSTMVQKLKTAGVWAKLDRLYIFATENQQHALKCIKTGMPVTKVGTPTWTQNTGYSGFTAANYLDTNYSAGTSSTAMTQNEASVGTYNLNDTTGTMVDIGAISGSSGIELNARSASNTPVRINAAALGNITVNGTNSIGFFAASRIQSNKTNGFKYGGYLTGTLSNASVPLLTRRSIFIGCRNNNGTPDQASTRAIAMAFIGGGLTSLEMDQFAQAVQVFALTRGWAQTTS
jgi:hypothetical protein